MVFLSKSENATVSGRSTEVKPADRPADVEIVARSVDSRMTLIGMNTSLH